MAALAACSADDRLTSPNDGPPQLKVSAADVIGGGRAGGHAEFTVGGIKSMYTFTAITTEYPAAKGRFQLHRWFPDGRMLVMTGEVDCMTIVPTPNGGLARMTGRVESLRSDNNEVFIPPGQDRTIWSVLDNGEGADSPPDLASGLLNFRNDAAAEFHCATGFNILGFPITGGNIQVQPD
jgi:hypothetical protein